MNTGQFKSGRIPWNKNKNLVKYIRLQCLQCGKDKYVMPSVIKFGRGKFCNRTCRTNFQKDKPVIPIGYKHSIETKIKIGLKSKGHKLNEKAKESISTKNSGENNGSWRGGVSIESKKIRTSSQ